MNECPVCMDPFYEFLSVNTDFIHFQRAFPLTRPRRSTSSGTGDGTCGTAPSAKRCALDPFTSFSLTVLRIAARCTIRRKLPIRPFGTIANPGLTGESPMLKPPAGTPSV